MGPSEVVVEDLVKRFRLHVRQPGLGGALRGLLRPERRLVTAVDRVSFTLSRGETVGYIGPNGAGKSTTIKVLCGVLWPTSGRVEVCGLSPQRQRIAVAQQVGVVFGQRTQLYWDLRLGESFELMRRIYSVDRATFRRSMGELSELLEIGDLFDIPVRQLSLGQRMRSEIAAAVVHEPRVLFLDEPTIGLDVAAKQATRELIGRLNEHRATTVILSSHDLADVAKICRRLIVINEGRVVEDGPLAVLIRKLAPYRLLVIDLEQPLLQELSLPPSATLMSSTSTRLTLRIDTDGPPVTKIIAALTSSCLIRDISVREPDIEEVVADFYRAPR